MPVDFNLRYLNGESSMRVQKFIFDGEKLVEGMGDRYGGVVTPDVFFHWLVNYESEGAENSKDHNYFDCRILIDHSVENLPIYTLVGGSIKQFGGKDTIVLRYFGYYLPDTTCPSYASGILNYSELERVILTKKEVLNPCDIQPLRNNPRLVSNIVYKALKTLLLAKTKDCFKFRDGRYAFVEQDDTFCIDATYYCIHGAGLSDWPSGSANDVTAADIFDIHMVDNFIKIELEEIANMGLGYPPGKTILKAYKNLVKKF